MTTPSNLEGDGTSKCPSCGVSTPHQHFIDRKGYVRGFMDTNEILGRTPDAEAAAEREQQKEAREYIAAGLEKHLDNALLGAMAASAEWKAGCKTCRMFSWSLKDAGIAVAMHMADRQYGMVRKGTGSFYCPDCGRCVWSDQS
jgi:predicted RNA-binding Zn-ribbon protein involved in translation (DUF1610 family)